MIGSFSSVWSCYTSTRSQQTTINRLRYRAGIVSFYGIKKSRNTSGSVFPFLDLIRHRITKSVCEIEHQHPKYKPGRRSQFSFNVSLYHFFFVSVYQLAPLRIGVCGFHLSCISHLLALLVVVNIIFHSFYFSF